MRVSKIVRMLVLGGALAASSLALAAATSVADERQAGNSEVTVGSFTDSETFTDVVPGDYPCYQGVQGTVVGRDTIAGRFNNAPDFFHAAGSDTLDYRIDFSDGRYVIGHSDGRFSFEANAGAPFLKDTHVGRESATVYGSDGARLGTVTISNNFHATYTDLNGNGEPDPGEITASVDNFRVTCG
jgi:hypothetical protein